MRIVSGLDQQTQELQKPSLESDPQLCIGLRLASGLCSNLYFSQSPIIIGRSESCDLQLPYPWVSLQHIEVHWSKTGICARDLYAKVPARVKQRALSATLDEPKRELILHLPSISLHCSLSAYSAASLYTEKQLLRRLWRPESGWIIWSSNPIGTPSELTLSRLNPNQNKQELISQTNRYEGQPKYRNHLKLESETNSFKIIDSQSWSVSRGNLLEHFDDELDRARNLSQDDVVQGLYWLILSSGQYQIRIGGLVVVLNFERTQLRLSESHPRSQRIYLVCIGKHLYRLDLGEITVFVSKNASVPRQLTFEHERQGIRARLNSFFRELWR